MSLDPVVNFGKVTVSTGYSSSATSIVLSSGAGAKLPSSYPFNLIWWNATDYPDPADDPNVEIVTVTAKSTDTLTVTRGQESTAASTKSTSSKTYKMVQGPTAKTVADLFGWNGFCNPFRNPGHMVDQRNTASSALTITTSGAYVTDGWIVLPTGASVTAQQVAAPSGCISPKALKVTGASSVTDIIVKQRIESLTAAGSFPNGTTVTVQCKCYVNSSAGSFTPKLTVKYPTAADNYSSTVTESNASAAILQSVANDALTTLSYTFTVSSANVAYGMEVAVDFGNNFNNSSHFVEVTDSDIRATPNLPANQQTSVAYLPAIMFRPIQLELALNQRYFEYLQNELPANEQASSSYTLMIIWSFKVTKRSTPVISLNATSGVTALGSQGPDAFVGECSPSAGTYNYIYAGTTASSEI